jgi:hypothetical protein
MNGFDVKLAIWSASIVFLAGGGWFSIDSMEGRVTKLEAKQDEAGLDIRKIMVNQSAICHAVGANCSR